MANLDQLSRAIGRIEANIDNIKKTQDETNETVTKMDDRLRNQERRVATTGGATSFVVAVFTSVLAFKLRGTTGL